MEPYWDGSLSSWNMDNMVEQKLFSQLDSSNTKMSQPPSRDVSPEQTNKTHSSLFGALNSEEFNIATENSRLKQEVKMLRESNEKLQGKVDV